MISHPTLPYFYVIESDNRTYGPVAINRILGEKVSATLGSILLLTPFSNPLATSLMYPCWNSPLKSLVDREPSPATGHPSSVSSIHSSSPDQTPKMGRKSRNGRSWQSTSTRTRPPLVSPWYPLWKSRESCAWLLVQPRMSRSRRGQPRGASFECIRSARTARVSSTCTGPPLTTFLPLSPDSRVTCSPVSARR
jgi:hypothetical protein